MDLFYRSMNGSIMLATVTFAPEPGVSTPRRLFDVILNFLEELRQRVR